MHWASQHVVNSPSVQKAAHSFIPSNFPHVSTYLSNQVLLADPNCHELLSELLQPHLERYVAPGDTLPPLHLEKCAAIQQVWAQHDLEVCSDLKSLDPDTLQGLHRCTETFQTTSQC